MKQLKFSTKINAPAEKVWNVLWQDETFREWAGIIDPGTYMIGELKRGSEVQFISSENGYGVTSLVEEVVSGEILRLRHSADTQEAGTREREKQWTGGEENYVLTEKDGQTVLTATFDVPAEIKDVLEASYAKAFARVKELAETRSH